MATIERFEDIGAWQKGREPAKAISEMTKQPEFSGDFGLGDQLRGAEISVMPNIAEGYERDGGNKDFRHFLSLAKGSAGEVRSQLYIAMDAGYISQSRFEHATGLVLDISKMLKASWHA